MADIEVRIVFNHTGKVSEYAAKMARAAVQKAARDIEAHAKAIVPVRTGTLKNSIMAAPEGELTWVIAPHTNYAIYVEFGTRYQQAKPYMRPAAEKVRPSFMAAMMKIIWM